MLPMRNLIVRNLNASRRHRRTRELQKRTVHKLRKSNRKRTTPKRLLHMFNVGSMIAASNPLNLKPSPFHQWREAGFPDNKAGHSIFSDEGSHSFERYSCTSNCNCVPGRSLVSDEMLACLQHGQELIQKLESQPFYADTSADYGRVWRPKRSVVGEEYVL
jgi:hypothetical protein